MTTKPATRIYWSTEERQSLCETAARLMLDLRASRKLDALLQAQEAVLPKERQRKLVALSGLDWFVAGLDEALERIRDERKATQANTSQVSEQVVPTSEPSPPADAGPSAAPAGLPELFGQMWPVLRQRLVSELASMVTDVLRQVEWPASSTTQATQSGLPEAARLTVDAALSRLRQVSSEPAASAPHGASAQYAPRKTSVLIVGLRGGQMEEVRRDFGSLLDLRFFRSEENKDRLRSMCEQAEVSVGMTDFINHSHDDILYSRSRRYIRSSGGITRLKAVLQDVVTRSEDEQEAA